jgi:hypothetical protein
MISIARKDGHSQRASLANDLPADAADMVKAVHGRENGHARTQRQEAESPDGWVAQSSNQGLERRLARATFLAAREQQASNRQGLTAP